MGLSRCSLGHEATMGVVMFKQDIYRRSPTHSALFGCMLALSACGGGGAGSIASTPVPDPNAHSVNYSFSVMRALDPAPAWTTGTYQAFAVMQNDSGGPFTPTPPGAVSLTVDTAAKTYALTVSSGSITVAPQTFKVPDATNPFCCDSSWTNVYLGFTVKSVTQWSDGVRRPDTDAISDAVVGQYTTKEKRDSGTKVLDGVLTVSSRPGRHVSLGQWLFTEFPLNEDGTTNGAEGLWSAGQFAFGNRTASSDIPASGTAHYVVETPEEYVDYGNNPIRSMTFDADFGARTIAAHLARSIEVGLYENGGTCCYGGEDYTPESPQLGTVRLTATASGVAPFTSQGSFDISLAGTGLVHTERTDKALVADLSAPVSGWISGAFYGPRATELGGTYSVPAMAADGSVSSWVGAFTAAQPAP